MPSKNIRFLTGSLLVTLLLIGLTWIPISYASGDISYSLAKARSIVVTSLDDSGVGTLRQALLDGQTTDLITFDSVVFPPTSPMTITLTSKLPAITTDSLTIDASYAGVVLNGEHLTTDNNGLTIKGAISVTIRGLQLINFPNNGIQLTEGTEGAIIGGNQKIGTALLGQGNLLSGNGRAGIRLTGIGTSHNQVLGNNIGTNITGNVPFGNIDGVVIESGASLNMIGSQITGTGNLISGNSTFGVYLNGLTTHNNTVRGNKIGTDATCTSALGNTEGIRINRASNNIIGGEVFEHRNIISGNSFNGLVLRGALSNLIIGNLVGTDCNGTRAIRNSYHGIIFKLGSSSNVIGGTSTETRNLISGNGRSGISIDSRSTINNSIIGNYIGTDVDGTISISNGDDGISIGGGNENIIEKNIISGNRRHGVSILNSSSINNRIVGNYIGSDVTGLKKLGNGSMGVNIGAGAKKNIIGGIGLERNIISGNNDHGIRIQDNDTTGNEFCHNYIGTNVRGISELGNSGAGIEMGRGASDNLIGCNSSEAINLISANDPSLSNMDQVHNNRNEAINLISGNGSQGIVIRGSQNNKILDSYIGTDRTGENKIPNNIGLEIDDSNTTENIISNTLISFNSTASVIIKRGTENVFKKNVVKPPVNAGVQNQWILGNFLIDNKFENLNLVPVIGGRLTENETWEVQGNLNTYRVVEENLVIAPGVTLTIAEGVNVLFDFGLGLNVESGGTLIANGSAEQPIGFTSAQRFGNPLSGDWQGLNFASGSTGSLEHVHLDFAQNGVTLNGGDVRVLSSKIEASEYHGVLIPTETLSGSLTLENNAFVGNRNMAINNQSTLSITVSNSWWGSASGPTHESNPAGSGDAVSANVDVENWRTDPGQKDAWLTAPGLNLGSHDFIIEDYTTLHWFRIPMNRGTTLTATLTHPDKDYDLFLFSNLEESTSLLDDIGGDMKSIGGDMKSIGGDMKSIGASVEACSPRYIGQVARLGRANRGRLLRESCDATIGQEIVSTGVWDQSGWYYLLVAGHNGANDPNISYTLSISTTSSVSGFGVDFTPPRFDPPESSQPGKKTLILTHRSRLEEQVEQPDRIPELMSKLDELAHHPNVVGEVIDLDTTYPQLNEVYDSWDDRITDTVSANYVAASIKALLTSMRGAYPDLENIIIVGHDQIIPFHRIPDEVTIANERSYHVDGDPVLTNNLREGYFLSDDYYAGFTPIPYRGRDMILPEYAIGRLVETPEEMITAIDTFLESPVLTVTTGLVTGYDFLIDQADAIADELGQAGVTTDTLISYSWQADQLKEKWLNTRHDLSSVNAHFEHGLALPAERDGGDVSAADVQASDNLTGTVVFSVGCHSGLSVKGSEEGQLDFAQVLMGRGAMYIGQTGYGYGDANAIGYSENLMQLFVRYLQQEGTVGQALRQAKSEYFNTTGIHALTPYDEKVLGVATFYGLPMIQVRMPNDTRPESRSADQAPAGQLTPQSNCPEGLTCYEATFSPVYATHAVTDGTYFSIDKETQVIPGQPILPRTSLSVLSTTITNTLEITVARGVLFEGGEYETFTNFNPVITRIVTESTDLREQELPYFINAWRPAEWERINSLRIADKIGQQLVITPFQYRSTTPWQGTARRFTDMTYTVYYSNTRDSISPRIWAVQTTEANETSKINVDVTVTDFSGIVRAVITYTTGDGVWKTVDMEQKEFYPNIWEGKDILPQHPDLTYFIQAVDGGGNVAIHDNKGRYFEPFAPEPYYLYLPMIMR